MNWKRSLLISLILLTPAISQANLNLSLGYGEGFDFLRSRDNEPSEVKMIAVFPSWTKHLNQNWDLIVEGQYLHNTKPRKGYFAGGVLDLRYNFRVHSYVIPFIRAGAGAGYLDFDLDEQSDGLNFVLQTGFGVRIKFITLEYRYHHISNARLQQPNEGTNAHMALIGFTF